MKASVAHVSSLIQFKLDIMAVCVRDNPRSAGSDRSRILGDCCNRKHNNLSTRRSVSIKFNTVALAIWVCGLFVMREWEVGDLSVQVIR